MHLNREVSISSRNPDPAPPPQEVTKTVLNHKHIILFYFSIVVFFTAKTLTCHSMCSTVLHILQVGTWAL